MLIHQGNDRTGFYNEFYKYDLVVTSYETITRIFLNSNEVWNIVVADEAQAIKNPLAKRTNSIKQIKKRTTIAVTGTSVENRLVDSWSYNRFCFPGYFRRSKSF